MTPPPEQQGSPRQGNWGCNATGDETKAGRAIAQLMRQGFERAKARIVEEEA